MSNFKREKNNESLKEVINRLLDVYQLRPKLNEVNVTEFWMTELGPTIAKHTTSIRLQKGILLVKLDSSALREELSYARTNLKKRINDYFGENMISDIRIN